MRLSGWHVDSFGVLRDVGLRGLPPGLVVLHGPNAAGKSTLLAFIQRTLFGYPHRNRQDVNHYEPADGDPRRGGRLFIDPGDGAGGSPGEEVTVERHDGSGLRVVHPGITADDEAALAALTGGCDDQLFNAVFAFDLDDLRSLERLTDDAVRDRLFSAGVRGAGRSARSVHDRLDAEARELWSPRSRAAAIDHLQERLRGIEEELQEARHLAAEYPERLAQETRSAREVEQLDDDLKDTEARERRAESLLAAWPVWRRRVEAATQLEEAGDPPQVPAGAVERHERLRAGLDDLAERIEHLEQERRRLVVDHDEVHVEEQLLHDGDEVLALDRERTAQRERLDRLTACLAELDRLGSEQVRTLEALGEGWSQERLTALDVPVEARGELRTFKTRLDRAQREVTDTEAAVARISTSTDRLRDRNTQVRSRLAEIEGDPPEIEEIERDREQLTKLRGALSESQAAASALQAVNSLQEHHRTQKPDWIVPTLGGLTVLMAVAGVLAALADAPAVMAVLVLAALGLLVMALVLRRSSDQREGQEDDPAVTAYQRASRAAEELAEPAQQLGLPTSPTFADLERLAVELDRAERLRVELDRRTRDVESTEAELADAEAELEAAQAAREEARREEQEATARWRAWCQDHGLDPGIDPTAAEDLVEALDRVRERQERQEALRAELTPLRTNTLEFASRTARILETAKRDPVVTVGGDDDAVLADQPGLRRQLDELRRLAANVTRENQRRAERDRLWQRIVEIDHELDTERARHERLHEERRELLTAAGVEDEVQLRDAVERAGTHRDLQQQLRQAENDLVERFGTGEEADRRREELAHGDREGWTRSFEEARRRRHELRRERDAALERLVEARRSREEVETSDRIVELDQQRQVLLAERDERVHDWRVARVARTLVVRTLEGFERERQPGVLRRAGEYFAQVTRGLHPGVIQRGDDLLVLDTRGRSWDVRTLSRGTAEQLYLCLRLALAEDLATRQQRLPFVMDDVLVNFDPERAHGVARLLVDVAVDRQLLYFTCHPATVELLRELGAAAVYDLPRGGGQPVRRAS